MASYYQYYGSGTSYGTPSYDTSYDPNHAPIYGQPHPPPPGTVASPWDPNINAQHPPTGTYLDTQHPAAYPDPNHHHAWQATVQIAIASPPVPPRQDLSHHVATAPNTPTTLPYWNHGAPNPPVQQPSLPLPPPPYDPAQRPVSWPSVHAPIPHQNHAPYLQPGTATTLHPPAHGQHSHAHASPAPHHGHHHSFSGPLSLPFAPGAGLPGFPSAPTPQVTDLAMEDALKIRDAFGVGGFHHPPVINIITNRSPVHLQDILLCYQNLTDHDLLATLKDMSRASLLNNLASDSTNNKHFNTAATAIFLGPVKSEGFWVVKAVKGSGTNDALLTEAIFGRSNAELNAMATYVRSCYGKTLHDYVRSDLSLGTKALFDMGMQPHPSKDPPDAKQQFQHRQQQQQLVLLDVRRIISATPSFNIFAKDSAVVCEILTQRTPAQVAAIAAEYGRETGKNLRDLIGRAIHGHMKDALLYIVDGAVDKVGRDARLLEDAMAGPGTKHLLLMSRLIRVHWDKQHLAEVKLRYGQLYKQELVHRLQKEIRGGYRDLMVAIAESDVSPWRR
ncbi:hypothetical protein TWF696_000025 [Orbilia brochopaga]|uniref:Annexin n=1 Tax=Orbilia brochopaga TaxID=3140254 RepID=A0AAV9V9Z9_9PEZI